MRDGGFSEHIEGMLDVMLYLPRRAWGFVVLRDVDKRIGTAELHKIIFRACDEYGSHTLKDSNAQSRRLNLSTCVIRTHRMHEKLSYAARPFRSFCPHPSRRRNPMRVSANKASHRA